MSLWRYLGTPVESYEMEDEEGGAVVPVHTIARLTHGYAANWGCVGGITAAIGPIATGNWTATRLSFGFCQG